MISSTSRLILTRAAPTLRNLSQRRTLSIAQRARSAIRNLEPHPFERYSTKSPAANADWGKQARKIADSSLFYFPSFLAVLGWPLAAEWALDGHVK